MHCLNTGLGDEPNRHTKDFSPPCTSSSSLWLLPRQRHQQDAIVVLVGNDRQIAARVDVYRELLRASHPRMARTRRSRKSTTVIGLLAGFTVTRVLLLKVFGSDLGVVSARQ